MYTRVAGRFEVHTMQQKNGGTTSLEISTERVSRVLMDEIEHALKTVKTYGSIEIYVQNSVVTQITIRNIRKTSVGISEPDEQNGKKQNR